MKRQNDLFSFHEARHPYAVRIINLLLIAVLGFLTVCCEPGEKLKIDLVKMDKKSLEEELEKVTEKSKRRVDILNELAYRERRSGPKTPPEKDAFAYADEAWRIAEKSGYKEGHIESLCSSGAIHFFRSEYKKSLDYYKDGLSRAEDIGWQRGQAMAYNGIARYHQVKGEYEKALENFIKSKEISKKIGEWRELAYANYVYGALYYYDQKDFKGALACFEKCLKLGHKIEDKDIISSGYFAVGEIYRSLNNRDTAQKYFDNCMTVSKNNNIRYNMANAFEGYGDLAEYKDNDTEAIKNYKKSLEIFKETGDQFQIIGIEVKLGRLYRKKKNYKEALKYLKKAYKLATKYQIPIRIKKASEEIIKVYEKSSDYKLDVDYFDSYQKNNEFLSKNNMLKLKLIYDNKKKSDEEKIIIICLIAGFIIILAASLMLLRKKRDLEKSNKDIERMSEIGQVVTSSLSRKEIYNRVFEQVKEIMDADCFWIYWYEEKLNRLDSVGGKEKDEDDIYHYYELTETNRPAVKCFLEQKPLIFKDYPNEYPLVFGEPHPQPKKGKSFNSHIFLPLIINGSKNKKIGVITVQSSKKNAYTDKHVNIFKNIGGYAAIALDNANAYKQIEGQKTRIEQQASELEEKKKQLEKTVQIEKEISHHKDELMYTVSHQYKTPLTIIQGSAQMIRDYFGKMKEEDVKKHLNKIFANLDYMRNLIESLLKFGKKFNPGYYDLRGLCEKFVDSIKANEGSQHHIEFKAAGDCARVKMDKDFMEIILSNLVMNSINYSARGSNILLDLSCNTDHAVVKVIDNGIGISDDYLKMPFERFHRGSNVGAIRGTGLGLALVKRYVDLHNGLIEIDSQLEKGTTITITLPKN